MADNDELYRMFLEELHSLSDFRLDYGLDHPDAELDQDDPDVRRIIEALAFFGAKTKMVALNNIDATRRRVYQQFFPYLLSPLSAMAMLQAKPTGHLTEAQSLPAGTEFALKTERGALAIFRSIRNLRVLPYRLEKVGMEALPQSGVRLLLTFRADYPLNEEPGQLSLHINYLNDFAISLKLFHYLQQALRRASVQYGDSFDEGQPMSECPFVLGSLPLTEDSDEWLNPLEAERYYFHYPRHELFLQVDMPPSPRNWHCFTLALDCREPWPRQINLNRNLFQLFTVPLANCQRGFAEPILCDGTRERYTIRHPHPEFNFRLQNIIGVYEITEQGMLPFRPGILAGGNGSYEVEQGPAQPGGGFLFWLVPHFPAAYTQPRTLAVEALWLQPWFDAMTKGRLSLAPFRRQIQGIRWELTDNAIPHSENQQINSNTNFMHLLTLMHKPCLSAQDTRDLLQALGSVSTSPFQNAFHHWVDMRLEEEPPRGAEMARQIYYLKFKAEMTESPELVETFTRRVGRVLNHWIADAVVEARVEKSDELAAPAQGVAR